MTNLRKKLQQDSQNYINTHIDVYETVGQIIQQLDNDAIKDLSGGYEGDIDKVLDTLVAETKGILSSPTRSLQKKAFGLDSFSESVEETLRCRSMNYFILTCLPDFILGWHNLEWSNLISIYRLLCVIAARDHGKSYHFSFAYPLWQMYRYRPMGTFDHIPTSGGLWMSEEGMLVTNEYKLGITLMDKIKEEIESNPILNARLMPESKAKGWGSEKIVCKNGASFYTRSANSKIRGLHPTYIVMDDFLNESSLYSAEQREKYWNIFSAVIYPALSPNGQLLIVGTPFFEQDMYGTIKKKGPEMKEMEAFPVLEYPAIFPDGTLLFPERHTFQNIMQKRSLLGSLIFSREIMVKPIADAASIFPYTILNNAIKGQDGVRAITNIDSSPKKYVKVAVGCDFAISSETKADYTVFTIMGVDERGIFHVLNSVRMHGANYKKQIAGLKKINRDFRPDIMYAEDNGMQQIFIQMMEDADLPVVGKTTNATNKKSLYQGIPSLAVLFESGRIKFPYGDERSRNLTDIYFSELNSVTFIQDTGKLESTTQHDDCAMSLWQGVKACKGDADEFDFSFV